MEAKSQKIKVEEICQKYRISKQTWYNWQKTKPELIKAILKDINESGDIKLENIKINGNVSNVNIGHHNKIMINGNDICKEICDALGKLPSQKQKKFYHKIMLEIFEELDNES